MSNGTDALTELKTLAALITSNIDRIEAETKSASVEFPSLSTAYSTQSEAVRQLPEVADATTQIIAAASQLLAVVRPPPMSVIAVGFSFHIPASLRVVLEAHVAEILREAGSGGAHVKDIAKHSNVDPAKLARILRLLATHHIFVEVSPDVFTNNRISSFLDSGKSVAELVAHPDQQYEGTTGMTAFLGHFGDEAFKGCAYLADVLLDPATSHSYEANKTAANKAFNTDLNMFPFFETPGNEYRMVRFGHAMNGSRAMMVPNAIVAGFDWKSLKDGALVVDVGGGVGSQSLTLAQNFPHLRFIVQDRPAVIVESEKFWAANKPDYLESGKVQFQPYDFLTDTQPVTTADVFFLRAILHDWADAYCVQILRRLRAAAAPHTRLLVIDHLVSYACAGEDAGGIPGVARALPPAPLLPNWGPASAMSYIGDIQMMAMLNGQERTATHLRDLLAGAGWKLVEVRRGAPGAGMTLQNAIAVPV
ncbi:S-adenosyl-L-methionine-dependent methyltransferase [Dentipellis sp. KUC8613]|nr:S-adenosyl-L-methionine-dependent methyltransferase [Dentipellis sp. KUC8613]